MSDLNLNLVDHSVWAFGLARMLKRQYPYMAYLWEAIECPYCHVPAGEPCKTKKGRHADMSHMGRVDEFKRRVDE